MTSYKTFFISSQQLVEKKFDKMTSFKVDGLAMKTEIQALLYKYESAGYELHSTQSIMSTNGQFSYTEGLIVILKLK
jgi:hypothetical protein